MGDQITTRPMKGTIKRGKSFAEDEANASWLYHSEKNRAENVMIVDLLRNDLGIIAEPGTVHVPKLFEIEQYPTVHQMTSTIAAKISENTQLVDIFKVFSLWIHHRRTKDQHDRNHFQFRKIST